MKRLFTLVILIGFGLWFFRAQYGSPAAPSHLSGPRNARTDMSLTALPYQKTLFVPYWQLDESFHPSSDYDRYVYFGVAGSPQGINMSDPGYQKLQLFVDETPHARWLTIRMTDSEVNDQILEGTSSQQKIISDAVAISQQFGFEGVVLDFEYKTLFGEKVEAVTGFYRSFGETLHKKGLKTAVTVYGDVKYRSRPYDLRAIQSFVDEVMIMAYDLHKSRGEPGPNFPLSAGKLYGYGYDRLLKDILPIIPAEKLTVIFGMYGYDWKVDEQKRPITVGESMTTAQITKNLIDDCPVERCTVLNDALSGETEINYVDDSGRLHIVWFENERSVQTKSALLKANQINSYAFWAYGYF